MQPGHILLVQMLVWCSTHHDAQLEISHELNSAVIIPRRVHLGGWMVIVSKSSSYALPCFTILRIWFQQPTPVHAVRVRREASFVANVDEELPLVVWRLPTRRKTSRIRRSMWHEIAQRLNSSGRLQTDSFRPFMQQSRR